MSEPETDVIQSMNCSTLKKNSGNHSKLSRTRPIKSPTNDKNKIQNERTKNKKTKAIVPINTLLPNPCTEVYEGEVLLCKMRGFPAWPARVTSIDKNMIGVTFFGDRTTWRGSIVHLYPFELSHCEIISNIKKRKDPLYAKSVQEAEHALKIPEIFSIFNKL